MTSTKPDLDRHAEASPNAAGDLSSSMLLPTELLDPGEVVILMLKPSVWYILLAPLRGLVLIVLGTIGLLWLDDLMPLPISRQDILLLGVGLFGIRVFWQFLQWLSRVYVLTDQRIIRVKGVFHVHVFETALKQLQHTQLSFLVRERLWGLGTISFFTAGTDWAEAQWQMVSRPLELHQKIIQTMNRYRR